MNYVLTNSNKDRKNLLQQMYASRRNVRIISGRLINRSSEHTGTSTSWRRRIKPNSGYCYIYWNSMIKILIDTRKVITSGSLYRRKVE